MTGDLIYEYFTDDDFLRFSRKIKEMELKTAGEIRLSIKEGKSTLERKKDIRNLAVKEFYKLKMQNTRDKTGIFLFILLKEKQFYILADSGINEKVPQKTWDAIRDEIKKLFKEGKFSQGVILGIEKVGNILSEFFPIKSDDINELSNKVVF